MLHLGGEPASYEDLKALPLPAATRRHRPVPHYTLVHLMRKVVRDQHAQLEHEEFRVSRHGSQALLVVTGRKRSDTHGFAIGVSSSTDRSVSLRCALGGVSFAGGNLMFRADLVTRKNTTFVWENFLAVLGSAARKVRWSNECIDSDVLAMRCTAANDDLVAAMLGIALFTGVMTTKQAWEAFRLWETPDLDELRPRTAWSAYNACSTALKTTHPTEALGRYIALHKLWTDHRPAFGRKLLEA